MEHAEEIRTKGTIMHRIGCTRHEHPYLGRRELLRFSVVRTMHHPTERQFRNEHNSCIYLLHTARTEMPPGDTNGSITQPRQGRFEWPSLGSLIAYAVPPEPRLGLPAVVELPRVSH